MLWACGVTKGVAAGDFGSNETVFQVFDAGLVAGGFRINKLFLSMRAQDIDLEKEKLCECPMLNKNSKLSIHVKTGNRPYVVNVSEASQTLVAGTVVCAFGRGKFVRHQANQADVADAKKEISYDLSGPESLVIHNGNLTRLGDLVEAKRKSGPSPLVKVNYFELTDKPEDGKPGNFTLKKLHDLRFQAQQTVQVELTGNGENVVSQLNMASLLPLEAWRSL